MVPTDTPLLPTRGGIFICTDLNDKRDRIRGAVGDKYGPDEFIEYLHSCVMAGRMRVQDGSIAFTADDVSKVTLTYPSSRRCMQGGRRQHELHRRETRDR